MYKAGDIIIYKEVGVCKVIDVAKPKVIRTDNLYYTLKPLRSTDIIYIPVDAQVYMREIISPKEVEEWILKMPHIPNCVCSDRRLTAQKEFYREAVASHDFYEIIGVIKGLYEKSRQGTKGKKALSSTEEYFFKLTSDLVHQEFGAALAIDADDMPRYIKKKLEG